MAILSQANGAWLLLVLLTATQVIESSLKEPGLWTDLHRQSFQRMLDPANAPAPGRFSKKSAAAASRGYASACAEREGRDVAAASYRAL